MIRRLAACLLAVLALPVLAWPARSEGVSGDFDYWVLSLSWSPDWCALEGFSRGSAQCEAGANGGEGFGFVLHGLWPQYEEGYPRDCATRFSDPSRRETEAMADIMGTGSLAWHEWRKHGTCSGLSAAEYFALAREAYEAAPVPGLFAQLQDPVRVDPRVVEMAFLREGTRLGVPGMTSDAVTVTCSDGMIQEVRLCYSRDMEPRACGSDAARDCPLPSALMDPVP